MKRVRTVSPNYSQQARAEASSELADLMSSDQPASLKLAAIQSVGYLKAGHSAVINVLSAGLASTDREVLLETIRTVARVGPAAATLKMRIQELAATNGDPAVATAAAAAARIE